MKRQLFTIFLLCILSLVSKQAFGQLVNFYYEIVAGPNDRDSVIVYAMSNSASSAQVSAVNFSFAFQSSCSASFPTGACANQDTLIEIYYSYFSQNWGSFLERCEIKNTVSLSYNSLTYNHRFSYGNSSILTPWVVPPSTASSRMVVMKLLLDSNCLGDIYMENETENPINQVSNATFSRVNYQIVRFGSAFPVEFVSFGAEEVPDKEVKLSWSTQQEINSDYFQIQKSYSGRFNEPIIVGELRAQGFSDEKVSYSFFDKYTQETHLFYRLKIVDGDGSYRYSQTAEVQLEQDNFPLLVGPNPVKDRLHISVPIQQDKHFDFKLYDLQSRILLHDQKRLGSGLGESLQWQMSHLPAGMYLLEASEMEEPYRKQTIKVHLY